MMTMKKIPTIPNFNNDEQAADFFDTHDTTEMLSQTTKANLIFPKPKHKVVVELQENQWQKLRKIAVSKKLSYTKILERFISKGLSSR
jgi:hypothetical protein